MSKQEEIREGFARTLGKYSKSADQVYQLLKYLHSKDVMIKVDREHPRMGLTGWLVAVEPLIKEESNGQGLPQRIH